MSLRHRVHVQLDPGAWTGSGLSPANCALTAIIIVATVIAIFQTEPLILQGNEDTFAAAEICLAAVFAVEYAARCPSS